MLDETHRRGKAAKLIAVLGHFLGRSDWGGLVVADVGCSGGIIADELARTGAHVVGLDIDSPGLARAQERYGSAAAAGEPPRFVCGDSMRQPLADASVDVAVCNHIYEHVVSPEELAAELRRVVRPGGVVYLGLGNKWGVLEPHYRLPFLSYLPRGAADAYVRLSGRAEEYYEQFRTRRALRRLFGAFAVWDYTHAVVAEPDRFAVGRRWPDRLSGAVSALTRVLRPVVPTFIWVGAAPGVLPQGPPLRRDPVRVR